ncbi:MAG: phenylalanine--tRNA ligase subunit beta, partial [Planctomycetes bacterium]|nr:phenylalanine--tRNA ligase subunit beta [Planctomycetota bacterium]
MIISWNWLGRYVDLSDRSPLDTAREFTLTTAEIEEVIEPPSQDFLAQFKVAEVVEVASHPNASKLSCCKVNDGETILDIVCGAANVRAGLKTVLAPIGAKIGDFKIKKAKLRGEPSMGMLCSEKELGVGGDDSGIIELSGEGLEPGSPASQVYSNLPYTWDLDNKAITHRPDLWGHYGLSRELCSIYTRDLQELDLAEMNGVGDDGYSISIESPEVCRRYCGLSIANIEVKDSPLWMQKLLLEVGLSPINNVVDATNFVMLELGQP